MVIYMIICDNFTMASAIHFWGNPNKHSITVVFDILTQYMNHEYFFVQSMISRVYNGGGYILLMISMIYDKYFSMIPGDIRELQGHVRGPQNVIKVVCVGAKSLDN